MTEENIFTEISNDLKSKVEWVNNCFGLARKIDIKKHDKKETIPSVNNINNKHKDLSPTAENGNYNFFYIRKRTVTQFNRADKIELDCSVIFWVKTENYDYISDVLKYFSHDKFIKSCSAQVEEIDDVTPFKDFSVKHEDNRYMMQPYRSFRFDLKINYINYNKIC